MTGPKAQNVEAVLTDPELKHMHGSQVSAMLSTYIGQHRHDLSHARLGMAPDWERSKESRDLLYAAWLT